MGFFLFFCWSVCLFVFGFCFLPRLFLRPPGVCKPPVCLLDVLPNRGRQHTFSKSLRTAGFTYQLQIALRPRAGRYSLIPTRWNRAKGDERKRYLSYYASKSVMKRKRSVLPTSLPESSDTVLGLCLIPLNVTTVLCW